MNAQGTMNAQDTINQIVAAARAPVLPSLKLSALWIPQRASATCGTGFPLGWIIPSWSEPLSGMSIPMGLARMGLVTHRDKLPSKRTTTHKTRWATDSRERLAAMSAKSFADQAAYWLDPNRR